jgi:glutathione S-transferase
LNDTLLGKAYVAGEFSVADPILFYVEFWADKTNIPLPENLAAHYRRMLHRPAVQRVLREEGYNFEELGLLPEVSNANVGIARIKLDDWQMAEKRQ